MIIGVTVTAEWWDECQSEVFQRMDEEILDSCMETMYTKEYVAQAIKEAKEFEEMWAAEDEQNEQKVSD